MLPHEQAAVVFHEFERVGVPIAVRRTRRLELLAEQRLRLVELALGLQQILQIADGGESVMVPIAERCTPCLERLAEQRLCVVKVP